MDSVGIAVEIGHWSTCQVNVSDRLTKKSSFFLFFCKEQYAFVHCDVSGLFKSFSNFPGVTRPDINRIE